METTYAEFLEDIQSSFANCINGRILSQASYDDREYLEYIKRFMTYLENDGYIFEKATPLGVANESRYMITRIEDENGFPKRYELCYFRYVVGIFGGCIAQLHDLRGNLLSSKGNAR